ncbi:kinase-like domain-containing protein [Trametes maxima]|nr:kinase-like domain-containing protein [Trametes maxima]
MSAPTRTKSLPGHAYLTDEDAVERYARLTREGCYDLLPKELFWQQRQPYLQENGYLLRPRYAPKWRPSWTGTKLDPTFCEDSILLLDYQVIDATRVSNNELVAIKYFLKDKEELHIAQFFSTIKDPLNHCVPVHQILEDPFDHESALMVMPYLRPCNDPGWSTVGDVVEFVSQTLEGLAFMHRHCVAHRDIAVANILMDAKELYPGGHHPVRLRYTPDALYRITPPPRTGHSIRYFYIDFGLSRRFSLGASPLVIGCVGRDNEVPELSDSIPYDAFKADIFALGNLWAKEFEQKYNGVEFLVPLIEVMTQRTPALRPNADQLLRQWEEIRQDVSKSKHRWRLGAKSEPALERVLNDTVAVAWEGIYHLKKFVN